MHRRAQRRPSRSIPSHRTSAGPGACKRFPPGRHSRASRAPVVSDELEPAADPPAATATIDPLERVADSARRGPERLSVERIARARALFRGRLEALELLRRLPTHTRAPACDVPHGALSN